MPNKKTIIKSTKIKPKTTADNYSGIRNDIIKLLKTARHSAARTVNAIMTATYWEIGRRIVECEQGGEKRAEYGEKLISNLSADLTTKFGRGFSTRNLKQMRIFYIKWPISQTFLEKPILPEKKGQTVSALSNNKNDPLKFYNLNIIAQYFPLPWSAYVCLLSVKKQAARDFYESEAIRCGWTVRQLDRQINSQFYERTALSRNKKSMLEKAEKPLAEDIITPQEAIRDPFVLEFLGLKDEYSESDMEDALIQHMTDFLMELGDDFAFIGRQRRLRLDNAWFRIDLLFFHRRLKTLLIIDLKVGRFTHADAGQMNLYLNYAKEHWMKPGENPPVGLILCASKGEAEAHYALNGLPNKILAAEYMTVLPNENALAMEVKKTSLALSRKKSLSKKK